MKKGNRTNRIKEASVSDLLDDFVDLDAIDDSRAVTQIDDEEYVTMMLKKEAKRTLAKHRKEPDLFKEKKEETSTLTKKKKKQEPPVMPTKMSLVKRCQNCYYSVGQHTIGGSCWCHCTNPGRSIGDSIGKTWVKSRLNLSCWKLAEL